MHDLKSLQLDDEDSSIYFINYISDDSDSSVNNHENESIHSPDDNNDDIDVSSLPNSLIITPVPQELFTNQQFKVKKIFFFCFPIDFILLRMNLNNYFVFMILKSSYFILNFFNVFELHLHHHPMLYKLD
jgi:hypothetical protein